MTALGLNSDRPRVDVQVGMRSGWLRHVGVAIGGASGAAVALGAYEVFRSQPDRSFQLLQVWGPAFLVVMLAIVVLGKFLDGLIQAIRESFGMVASSVHDSAVAGGRQADALSKLADQGGKQGEEVRRLAIYAAQEFPGVYERFDRQDATLEKQNGTLEKQTMALQELTQSMTALTSLSELTKVIRGLRAEGEHVE